MQSFFKTGEPKTVQSSISSTHLVSKYGHSVNILVQNFTEHFSGLESVRWLLRPWQQLFVPFPASATGIAT